MNGKKGSVTIDVCLPSTIKRPESGKETDDGGFYFMGFIWSVRDFCKEDRNRVIFSLKVGFAVLLVSLLILFRAPYEIFGTNIIWSLLTVAIMFEYTVGATFNRGFNRALGSLLAGIFAIAMIQVAICTGRITEPLIIGLSIFLIGTITSFMKLWPSLVQYEYGFRVILFTFCLIIVSGYRMGNPVKTAMDRLYSIAIGGLVAVLVNILVCPIWAGEQLHKELVNSFDSVADSLEECVRKYLEDDGSIHPEFSKTINDEFADEPAFRRCRATLNSSAKLDSLANSAKWEPPHGRFRHFFYPWSEYVKVGAVLRYCAYEVMALHGVLHSEIQAPYNLQITFQSDIIKASSQATKLLRSLGKDISNMRRSLRPCLLQSVHDSTERLQCSIDIHSYLLTSSNELLDCSTKLSSVRLSTTLSSNITDLSNSLAEAGVGLELNLGGPPQTTLAQAESYHETMKKQPRRLHSWPSRDVRGFEEEGGDVGTDFLPRMRAIESTTSLSLATFTSLLIEFVARLDHLVEAVDKLAKLANFKHESAPYNLRITFQSEIMEASSQAAELLRSLGKDICNMRHSLRPYLLQSVHDSTERLQRSIDIHSYLLTSSHELLDCSTKLPSIRLSTTPSSNFSDLSNNLVEVGGGLELNLGGPSLTTPAQAESYHETMKKQQRRLHSWPSRDVGGFEEEGGDVGTDFLPRMRALESTTSLSLATFTSLLIEFVARLDHLVEAVDELAKLANFKYEGVK